MDFDLDALQLLPTEDGETEMQCAYSCGHTCSGGDGTCSITG